MPLKRGIQRESCDFCFRRKVKCDRAARAATGLTACSQCDLRQTSCTFESDDTRNQRRRKNPPRERILSASTSNEIDSGQHTRLVLAGNNHPMATSNSAPAPGNDALPLPFHSHITDLSSQLLLDNSRNHISTESSKITLQLPPYPDFEFEYDFEPSPTDFLLLDSIVPQNDGAAGITSEWDAIMPNLALQLGNDQQTSLPPTPSPYCSLDIQSATLDIAIDAYFNFANLALALLTRDGFMADYKAHRSSSALVFAVACRGCPFIQTAEKWSLQQRLASQFRQAFLEARSSPSSSATVRLDDLEALALMVDFEYEKRETSPLLSQLENLLLTHDSMVTMTLQYRIETHVRTGSSSVSLCMAAQRQAFLFWHVYGWDAFRSLDCKMPSRIQDEELDLSRSLHGHEFQSYFDAVLGLAGIARNMVRVLCGPVTRRKGARHQDVENLYKQLEEWRKNNCLADFSIQLSGKASSPEEMSSSFREEAPWVLPIHKAIVMLLELNCYMQIDACVSQYGIEEHSSLTGQIADMRVRYETLQAAHKIVEVARWIEQQSLSNVDPASTATMADLAPGIIRNICAGAHNWIYQKAKEVIPSIELKGLKLGMAELDSMSENGRNAERSAEWVESWMGSLTTLRDAAAAATSHRDTRCMIERLDGQRGSLMALI